MSNFAFKTSAETQAWAGALVPQLRRPCVVLLDGDVGAGKTQLVRWLLEAMGVKDAASPTFAVYNRHDSASGPIDHADLYRLKSAADLESSGFWDLLLEPKGLLFVEWAGRLPPESWPKNWTRIHIELFKGDQGEESRRVKMETRGPKPPET